MNILHIEDHNGIVELVKLLCGGREPFYVDSAYSLSEAQEKLSHGSYDLLLIDLNLSDSKGLDTVRALKSHSIPMVVLTADPTESFAKSAVRLGVADYITKSVLASIDLPCRLAFVRDRSVAQRRGAIKWEGIELIKPYLSCGAFA